MWVDVAGGVGLAVAVANNSNVAAYTTDGINWTQTTLPAFGLWNEVILGNQYFVIIQEGNSFLYSSDGKNWGLTYIQYGLWNNIQFCSNSFYVTQPNSNFSLTSQNGYVWINSATLPSSSTWSASTYSNYHGQSVLISASNAAAISTDCKNWTETTLPLSLAWNAITSSDSTAAITSAGLFSQFGGVILQNELLTTTTTTSTTPLPLPTGANARIADEFADFYSIEDLGSIYGYDNIYAVCLFRPNPLYILISAEKNNSNYLLKVPVNRDPLTKRIRSFGIPEILLETPLLIWGGLAYGPGGILFATPNKQNYDYTRYVYQINQDLDWISTDLENTTLPEINGLGSIGFAPPGFYNAGQAVLISINEGRFYKYDLEEIENEDWYSFSNPSFGAPIDKTPAGFSYPNIGSAGFNRQSILVSEYDVTGVIAAYEIYTSGGANLNTKRNFVENVYSPIGSTIDPFTGDLLFTHFNPCTGKRGIYLVYGGFLPTNKKVAPEGYGTFSGYFCGGTNSSGATPIVDKISFASDVSSPALSGLINSYNYAAGLSDGRLQGFITDGLNYLETMPFSTEVFSSASNSMSTKRSGIASANILNAYGYVFGGFVNNNTDSVALIDKMSFNTGIFSNVPAVLSTSRGFSGGLSDFNKSAYIVGGFSSNDGYLNSVEQFVYATDVTFINSTPLGTDVAKIACLSSYTNFGYVAGGTPDGTNATTNAYKINYATTVISFSNVSQLQNARAGAGGLSQGTIKGYFQSGKNDQNYVITAEKFFYYLETSALSSVSQIGDPRDGIGCFGKLYSLIPQGYMAGGSPDGSSLTNITEKIIFNADVAVAKDTANLSTNKMGMAGVSDEDIVAYFAGGSSSSSDPYTGVDTVDKLLYETEVTSSIGTVLSEPRVFAFTFSDIANAGYFAGGTTGNYLDTCEKITYSNDTRSIVSINLAVPRMAGQSAYSYTKGYMAGGNTSSNSSTNIIEALTYSTETIETLPITMPIGKSFGGGVSFRNMRAFFVGGIENIVSTSSVSMLDMIADSISISTPLALPNFGFGIVTDGYSKGYLCGGAGGVTFAQIFNFNIYTTAISSSAAITPRTYLSGVSKIYKDAYYSYYGSGVILLSGSSKAIFRLSYTGSGTILLYGSSEVTISLNLFLPINYRIQKTLTRFLPINYQVGRKVYYAYRIEGECLPIKKCGDAPFVNEAIECPVRSIQTIIATSVQEVCRKLVDQNWIWPIKRFQKYSKPVYKIDEEYLKQYGLYNEECIIFEDQPFCNFNDCIDFCADYLVEQVMIMEDNAILTDNTYVGSGIIFVSGRAKTVTTAYNYIGQGSITMFGIAPFSVSVGVIQTRHYVGVGLIELNGEAPAGDSNVGTYDQAMIMIPEVENYKIIYASTKGLPINTTDLNTNLTICECRNIQSRFILMTNLNKNSIFTNFLASNNLLFSKNILMKYNYSRFSFFYNQQYSIGRPSTEQWIINLSLISDVDNNAASPNRYKWFFNLHFLNRKRIGSSGNFDNSEANVRVWIPSQVLCPESNYKNMDFTLAINVKNETCIANGNILINNVFVNDNLGIFTSGDWQSDPILRITYSPFKQSLLAPSKLL